MQAEAALAWWYRVLRSALSERLPDLTTRQLALLLHVGLMRPPHTVRGLSQTLGFSKPAVTRALDRLVGLNYVERQRDPRDRRSVLIRLTRAGETFLAELGQLAGDAAGAPLAVA
ncbi:MAG TPA: MarR family transcriptional regulator [Kiloniellales bacterium]|nr:MarR family transcriptional regulator [Kiloniellales bacterium]